MLHSFRARVLRRHDSICSEPLRHRATGNGPHRGVDADGGSRPQSRLGYPRPRNRQHGCRGRTAVTRVLLDSTRLAEPCLSPQGERVVFPPKRDGTGSTATILRHWSLGSAFWRFVGEQGRTVTSSAAGIEVRFGVAPRLQGLGCGVREDCRNRRGDVSRRTAWHERLGAREWRRLPHVSAYARGLDALWGVYQWLDRAAKGAQRDRRALAPAP